MSGLVAVLLAVGSIGMGQGLDYDMAGKTEAQILAMGRDRWFTFYTQEAGNSNQSMILADDTWAVVEGKANDRLARRAGIKRAALIAGLRKDMNAFTSDLEDVGSALSGGGTMWFGIDASWVGDIEDALHDVLTGHPSKSPIVVSKVVKRLNQASVELAQDRSQLTTGPYSRYEDDMKEARVLLRRIARRCKALPRSGSDWVLGTCDRIAAWSLEQSDR
jgi:hypothetical protein